MNWIWMLQHITAIKILYPVKKNLSVTRRQNFSSDATRQWIQFIFPISHHGHIYNTISWASRWCGMYTKVSTIILHVQSFKVSRVEKNFVKTESSLYMLYHEVTRQLYQISLGHLSADMNVDCLSNWWCGEGWSNNKSDLLFLVVFGGMAST